MDSSKNEKRVNSLMFLSEEGELTMKNQLKATALAIAVGLSALGTAQAADRIAFIPKLVGVGFLPVVDKVQQKWAKH